MKLQNSSRSLPAYKVNLCTCIWVICPWKEVDERVSSTKKAIDGDLFSFPANWI